jgi:hypothetical protein
MNTYIPTSQKTKAIKKALSAHFPAKNISVVKETGTASHWISSRVTIERPADCFCDPTVYGRCRICSDAINSNDRLVDDVASKALTDLGASFGTYYSDDYSDSTPRSCHSISINFH